MSLEVTRIQSYKTPINFVGHKKTEVSEPKKEKENQDSFKPSKKVIIATTAVGIAALVVAAIMTRILKSKSRHSNGDFADLLPKSAREKLEAFKSKLNGDNASEDIKNILAEDNDILKFEAIRQIIDNGSKHINENTWENIFNTLIALKPTNELKEKFIVARTNNLLKNMHQKGLLKSEAIDKILSKTENATDNLKVNILYNLSEGYYDGININAIVPDFSAEQIKKALNILDGVKGTEFVSQNSAGGLIEINTKLSIAGLRYKFSNLHLKKLKLDENYITEFKDIINNDKLPDDLKLQIIDDIHLNYELGNKESEIGIKLYREMLLALEKNKADTYSIPNQIVSFVNYKFDLGCQLLSHIKAYDSGNITSLEDKLRFTQMLKKMSETVENQRLRSHYINDLYNEELTLKNNVFYKNFSDKTTAEDIEKFVDEMLSDYRAAKEHFIEDGNIFENIDKEGMTVRFDNFRFSMYVLLERLKLRNRWNVEELSDINSTSERIENKIEQFARKYFSESKEYKHTEHEFHGAKNFVKDKTEQTKAEIIKYLSEDEDFNDIIERLNKGELNKDVITKLKRKVALKYHPDRVQTEEEKKILTAKFQKIYGLVEILEKAVN